MRPRTTSRLHTERGDAKAVAESVSASLAQDYDILREEDVLDKAGGVCRIEASELKCTGTMPDQLQVVYIIPADDGCRVATARFSIEGAEGFGRRFAAMMNTFEVIKKWSGADFGEQPGYEYGWTGEDFGEQPGYDYGD